MRCDDVFEILTACSSYDLCDGSGEGAVHDGALQAHAVQEYAVQEHLASCHECRQLALALESLEDGAVGRDQASSQGCPSLAERVQVLVEREHAQTQAAASAKRRQVRRFLTRVTIACAALSLFLVAGAFGGPALVDQWSANPPRTLPTLPAAVLDCSFHSTDFVTYISNSQPVPEQLQSAKDACCVQCHGGKDQPKKSPTHTIGLVVLSCQKCHQGSAALARL